MSTGFNGTPMPSFLDGLQPEQRWAITDFIVSLSGATGLAIPTSPSRSMFRSDRSEEGPRLRIRSCRSPPIIGQVAEPGRAFHPATTSVTVQAVYDAESIAILVRWHDMSAQKTGKNAPSLPVPPERRKPPRPRRRRAPSRPQRIPLPRSRRRRPTSHPSSRTQWRSDSDAGADGRPQALLHLRRRSELRRSLVLQSGGIGSASVHRPWKCGYQGQRRTGCNWGGELRPGRMVCHIQAASSIKVGRCVLTRTVSADRLLGVGRVLARARQQAWSHDHEYPSMSRQK